MWPAAQRDSVLAEPCTSLTLPAQTDRVHLRCHRPGRQRLPPGGRAGGSPEAPRLHGEAHVPENPAHPAASQVSGQGRAPPPAVPRSPDPAYFPDKENRIFFKSQPCREM
uniref:Death associated protein n=1 Tax=Rousettus aegyptiacus TaxID=9407 RepID=A0A7J8EYD2_ROUAE|nr:death associated protein [Rousettus aegyptiacus]